MRYGRAFAGALIGLLFFLFVALDLVLFGVLALDSAVVTVLMAIGLVGGGALGWMAGAKLEHAATRHAPLPPPMP